jgi:Putative Actinobacterial Holin-X, holin superfamily III
MADTVDTAASSSSADEAEDPQSRETEADEPKDQADGADAPEGGPSLTELFEQLGRELGELGELGMSEAQLEAARNMPEVRRASRDIVGAVVAVIAALTAFAFLNVAAMDGLTHELPSWLAALVLAAFWTMVAVLLFLYMKRARQWLFWIVLKAPPTETVEELERERNAAGRAAMSTIEQIGPALAVQVALATVPDAGDVAGGVVEMSGSVLEASDEIVEVMTEQLPGGGVVNQVWDVALMPGRLGIKVATTVLRRGRPGERSGVPARGRDAGDDGRDGRSGPAAAD